MVWFAVLFREFEEAGFYLRREKGDLKKEKKVDSKKKDRP